MTQTDLRSFLAAIEASGDLVATDQEVDCGSDVPVLMNLPRRPRADAHAVGRWLVPHG